MIARQLRLVTLLTVGLCGAAAQAQTPDFSLPPLPPLPGASVAASPVATPPAPASPTSPVATVPAPPAPVAAAEPAAQPEAPQALPELANLPTPQAAALSAASAQPEPNLPSAMAAATMQGAPAVPPPTAEGANTAQATPPPLLVAPPSLNLPGQSVANTAPEVVGSTETVADGGMLPDINGIGEDEAAPDAVPPRPAARTWETVLAPAIVPKETTFNYRRQILPDAIYRPDYDAANAHLPTRITRDDYARLLISRVAADDLDATRALLDRGLSVNTADGSGRSLLTIARHAGASATARLLVARGAQG